MDNGLNVSQPGGQEREREVGEGCGKGGVEVSKGLAGEGEATGLSMERGEGEMGG